MRVTYSYEDEGEERLPTAVSLRPLTVPQLTLVASTGIGVSRIPFIDNDIFAAWSAGVAFGILDSLQVFVDPIQVLLAPDVDYGDIPLGVRFRFLDSVVEMAADLVLLIPLNTDFALTPSVPVRIHLGEVGAIDTGVRAPIRFGEPEVSASLVFPLEARFQIIEMLHVGVLSGVVAVGLQQSPIGVFVPAGVEAGFSLPGDEGPIFDIIASFAFPSLFFLNSDFDKVVTEIYVFGIGANIYFFL